jgi:hypothetical protein
MFYLKFSIETRGLGVMIIINRDWYPPFISIINVANKSLGNYSIYFEGNPELLFCNNETNVKRLYGVENNKGFFKDGINDYLIHGNKSAVNFNNTETKAVANYL